MSGIVMIDRLISMVLVVSLAVLISVVIMRIYVIKPRKTSPEISILQMFLGRTALQTDLFPEGIVFGKLPFPLSLIGRYAFSPANKEGAVLIVGCTGSGKTAAGLIPILRSFPEEAEGSHVFVVDCAGDIERNIPRSQSRIVYRPEDPNCAYSYDPFMVVDALPDLHDQMESLERMAFSLMPLTGESKEGQWFVREGRKILTAALISYHIYGGMGFIAICEKIAEKDVIYLLNDIAETSGRDPEVMRFIKSFVGSNEKNTAGCKQSIDAALKFFATNHSVKQNLGERRVKKAFQASFIEDFDIYICVSERQLELYAPLIGLITSELLSYCTTRVNPEAQILVALDEMSAYGNNIEAMLMNMLQRGRKRGVRLLCATQSITDLTVSFGRNKAIAMLANFSFLAVMGIAPADYEGQMYFSNLAGDHLVKYDNYHSQEKLYSPADFITLKDDLILFTPDGNIKLKKNYYFK